MDINRVKRNDLLSQKVIKGLQSRGMEGFYAKSREEALEIALGLIPKGSSVSWGGSMSIAEIGLSKAMHEGNYTVYDRADAKSPEEKKQIEWNAFACDYFLSSANAVSEDGELVNIDGFGNRVAAIANGPKHVIMIVGMNKVVHDIENAVSRARNEAAPMNAQRFDIDTPCAKTGACFDCKSPDTICCQFLVTRYSRPQGRIKVILVNDELGF